MVRILASTASAHMMDKAEMTTAADGNYCSPRLPDKHLTKVWLRYNYEHLILFIDLVIRDCRLGDTTTAWHHDSISRIPSRIPYVIVMMSSKF